MVLFGSKKKPTSATSATPATPAKKPLIKKKVVVKRPSTAAGPAQSQDYDQFGGAGAPARGGLLSVASTPARKSRGA